MRAVLEYSLPEEREEFELATNASNVRASISHLNGEKLDDIYIETWESRK